MLNPNETRQNNKAFAFPETGLSLLTALRLCFNAYQSQRRQLDASKELDFLVDLALLRSRSRDDFACYLWWEQDRKSSGRNQKEETVSFPESLRGSWSTGPETVPWFESRSVEFFRRGQLQGLKLGLELGTLFGETRQRMRNQDARLSILSKKFRRRSSNNTHITTLQMSPTKIPKIVKPTEVASRVVSAPQNIAVEELGEDEDDWAEINCWWRHLPKSYIRQVAHTRDIPTLQIFT